MTGDGVPSRSGEGDDPLVARFEELLAEAGDPATEASSPSGLIADLRELGRLLDAGEDERLPDSIGRFRPLRLLGEGGHARVYLALDPRLDRTVAIKVLHHDERWTRSSSDVLAREARTLARFDDPHVLRVHECVEEGDDTILVTEFVPGPTLEDVLRSLRGAEGGDALAPFAEVLRPCAERARLVARLARSLAACHAAGVLHRDLKPTNVLLPEPGRPKLIDFGLSHLRAGGGGERPAGFVTSSLVGTVPYLAPEQVDDRRTGARVESDVFSLGVILYELLTLRHPFLAPTRDEILDRVSRAAPERPRAVDPRIPVELEWIVLRALERDPRDRYATMAELAEDLEAFLEHRPLRGARRSPLRAVRRTLRRHGRAVRTAAVTLAVAAVGVVAVTAARHAAAARALSAGADELARGAARLDTPDDVEAAFDALDGCADRAARLEASWLQPLVGGTAAEDVDRARDALLARCDALVVRECEAAGRIAQAYARTNEFEDVARRWAPALASHRRHATPGERWREGLCRLVAPDGARVDRVGVGIALDHEPCDDHRALAAGTYRLTADDPLREVTFTIEGVELALVLDPPPLDAALAERLVPVDPSAAPTADLRGRDPPPPFEMTPRDATNGALRAALRPADRSNLESLLALTTEEPFDAERSDGCTATHAEAFSLATGARLPTPFELWIAARVGAFEPETNRYYWTCHPVFDDHRFLVDGGALAADPERLAAILHSIPASAYERRTRLRLVRTLPR